MLAIKRFELQCLKGYGPNYKMYKEKVRSTILSPQGLNYNTCNVKVQITMLETIRSQLQCLKG